VFAAFHYGYLKITGSEVDKKNRHPHARLPNNPSDVELGGAGGLLPLVPIAPAVPQPGAVQKLGYTELDESYRRAHSAAAFSTSTLAHLVRPGASGVTVTTRFPLAAEILGVFSVLSNGASFQTYFEDDLPEDEAFLRATAIRVVMRLFDNYVRSSVAFSPNVTDLAPMLKSRKAEQMKEELRHYINEHWETMYAKLLQAPVVVLESIHVKAQIAQAVKELESPCHPEDVTARMQRLLLEHSTVAQQLAQIVAAVILSPQKLALASGSLCFGDTRGMKLNVVAESGGASKQATLLLVPSMLQSDGQAIGKPYVYKVMR
jgi:hypothetical protein